MTAGGAARSAGPAGKPAAAPVGAWALIADVPAPHRAARLRSTAGVLGTSRCGRAAGARRRTARARGRSARAPRRSARARRAAGARLTSASLGLTAGTGAARTLTSIGRTARRRLPTCSGCPSGGTTVSIERRRLTFRIVVAARDERGAAQDEHRVKLVRFHGHSLLGLFQASRLTARGRGGFSRLPSLSTCSGSRSATGKANSTRPQCRNTSRPSTRQGSSLRIRRPYCSIPLRSIRPTRSTNPRAPSAAAASARSSRPRSRLPARPRQSPEPCRAFSSLPPSFQIRHGDCPTACSIAGVFFPIEPVPGP